jgi:hypothetical protein
LNIFLGLEEYGQAEGYLSKARYNVLEHPECANVLRSRLHRAWGRLMLVTGRVENARHELAEDVRKAIRLSVQVLCLIIN